MKRHLYVAVVVVAALAAMLGGILLVAPDDEGDATHTEPAAAPEVVRDDSHRLSRPEKSELTLVEFLDFECEACGAVYPAVEKLREEYGDRVTFVVRYFPMPGHRNSELAARTAEAAAQQDKFEEMYKKLFATQEEWGEAQESKESVFRSFARGLGLDMAEFDADLAVSATAERVRADQRDGLGLGVRGTPTFFLGSEKVETPRSYEAFRSLIEEKLRD